MYGGCGKWSAPSAREFRKVSVGDGLLTKAGKMRHASYVKVRGESIPGRRWVVVGTRVLGPEQVRHAERTAGGAVWLKCSVKR